MEIRNARLEVRAHGIYSGLWVIGDVVLDHGEADTVASLVAAIGGAAAAATANPIAGAMVAAAVGSHVHDIRANNGTRGEIVHVEATVATLLAAAEVSYARQ